MSVASPSLSADSNEPETASASNELDPEPFRSVLFATSVNLNAVSAQAPECFHDLNLDQIVSSMIAGREEYDLSPYFYSPLKSVEAVNYRYDVLRDLQDVELLGAVHSFAQAMQTMRASRTAAEDARYKRERQRWFLTTCELYVAAIEQLHQALSRIRVRSLGFKGLRSFLAKYVASEAFVPLLTITQALVRDLEQIRYSLHIAGLTITVGRYRGEPDYGADVVHTFAKFNQGKARRYSFTSSNSHSMNHLEAAIVDLVADLNPEVFARLAEFHDHNQAYADRTLTLFDREVQFYVACLEHTQRFQDTGLSFCYPEVSSDRKDVFGSNVYDLALATKLLRSGGTVVTNDLFLSGPERILVVSGPNQGGKTTLARTFGQLHYLASIGCPVPGTRARLFLFDTLFTHFEEEENVRSMTGKLEDELLRIRAIFDAVTPNSILIMNESFVSTTVNDALLLSRKILQKVIELDILCVTVTFLDELASLGESTVSMVGTVDPSDQSSRTYKVIRKAADGLAYARTIAEKYGLTRSTTKSRISANMREHVLP